MTEAGTEIERRKQEALEFLQRYDAELQRNRVPPQALPEPDPCPVREAFLFFSRVTMH